MSFFLSLVDFFRPPLPEQNVLLIGLSGSGTTSLHQCITTNMFPPSPLPSDCETPIVALQHKTVMLKWWDLPGTGVVQVLWPRYYDQCAALVLVLDATEYKLFAPDADAAGDVLADGTDKRSVKELLVELLANKDLRRVPVVLFAARSDVDGACKAEAIKVAIDWENVIRGHEERVAIIEGSSKTGDGREALLDLLEERLRMRP